MRKSISKIEANVKPEAKLLTPLEEKKRMESVLVSKRFPETDGESTIVHAIVVLSQLSSIQIN
ncbi:hypothetical protein HKD37_10G030054 [Glycine soja]